MLQNIAICTQEYPRSRGFCSDDHIHKDCHTVTIQTETDQNQLTQLLETLDKQVEADVQRRVKEWFASNPGETECEFEGDEFVGSTWVEYGKPYEPECERHGVGDSYTRMIEILTALIED